MYCLAFFYAFTGCDTVSSMFKKGKCKSWDTWHESSKKDLLTQVFCKLGDKPDNISVNDIDILEEFVYNLYTSKSRKRTSTSLNTLRLDLFRTSADNDFRKLPPCRETLLQHAKRSCYQSGFLWKEALEDFVLPNLTLWGWTLDKNGSFIPLWQSEQSPIGIDAFITTCSCQTSSCKN